MLVWEIYVAALTLDNEWTNFGETDWLNINYADDYFKNYLVER